MDNRCRHFIKRRYGLSRYKIGAIYATRMDVFLLPME